MKQSFDLLNKQTRRIALKDDERVTMRESLISYMENNPTPDPQSVAALKVLDAGSGWKGFFVRHGIFILLGVVALGACASVAVAATRALPGDTLYTVKRGQENVRSAFALSTRGKAENELYLAERRLSEAESLQQQSRLSAAAGAELFADFKEHIANFSEHTQTMAMAGKSDIAAKANLRLISLIGIHSQILNSLDLTIHANPNNLKN